MGKNTITQIAATLALNLFLIAGMAHAKEVLTEKTRFRDYLVKIFRDDETGEKESLKRLISSGSRIYVVELERAIVSQCVV